MRAASASPVVSEGHLIYIVRNKDGKAIKYLVQLADGRNATLKVDTRDIQVVRLAKLLREGDKLSDLYIEDRGNRGALTAEPFLPSLKMVVSGRQPKIKKRLQFEDFIETLTGEPVPGKLVKISWNNGHPEYFFDIGSLSDARLDWKSCSPEVRSLTGRLKAKDRISKLHVSVDRVGRRLAVVPDLASFQRTVKGRESFFYAEKPDAENA